MSGVHETSSGLTLISTLTIPGFGVIDPDSRMDDPSVIDWDATASDTDVVSRKVALTVTGMEGMVKAQGLRLLPPVQEAPVTVQVENTHPGLAVAETEIGAPEPSWQPEGQFGETDPEPDAIVVVREAANPNAKLFACGDPQPVTGSQPTDAL
jgi:hypothetical protein